MPAPRTYRNTNTNTNTKYTCDTERGAGFRQPRVTQSVAVPGQGTSVRRGSPLLQCAPRCVPTLHPTCMRHAHRTGSGCREYPTYHLTCVTSIFCICICICTTKEAAWPEPARIRLCRLLEGTTVPRTRGLNRSGQPIHIEPDACAAHRRL